MRRILVMLTIAGLAAGAAQAASGAVPVLLRTSGAERVELKGGNGRAVVARRGALLVNVRQGRIRVIDLPGAGRPILSERCRRRAKWIRPGTVQLEGAWISCFIQSGQNGSPWQVVMRGRGISASGVVRGSVTLDALNRGVPGRYRIGGGDWERWPRRAKTITLNRK